MTTGIHDMVIQLQKDTHVLKSFNDTDIANITPYFRLYTYTAGTIVFKPGETLDLLGIILSGEVIIEEETKPKGNWIVLSRMVKGAILAHPTLFGSDAPPVRVIVKEDVAFLGTDGASFEDFLNKHPDTGIKFLKELIRVLFARFRGLADRISTAF